MGDASDGALDLSGILDLSGLSRTRGQAVMPVVTARRAEPSLALPFARK
jgi:hypothetical protein